MRKRISREELVRRSTEQTEELIATMNRLSNWIEDVHYPSTGSYLESLISSHLRRRLPNRFSVSTGFLSSIEKVDSSNFERFISNQFDILVWDSHNYPPLFQNDNFVIIVPQSCYAIIEVTNTLNGNKIQEDIRKLDSCFNWYGCYRQSFQPFTAIIGFKSNDFEDLESIAKKLLEILIFNHNVPFGKRYELLRKFSSVQTARSTQRIIGFPSAICAIDKGLVYSEQIRINGHRYAVYQGAYSSQVSSQVDSFGLFEKKLLLDILEKADSSIEFFEYDLYSEFLHASGENKNFFSILNNFDENLPFDIYIQNAQITHDVRFYNRGNFLSLEYNQKTKNGSKKGYWIEDVGIENQKAYGKYHGGKRQGLWSYYCLDTNCLLKIEEYNKKGKLTNEWKQPF
jgi:hypothetical protein